MSQKCEMCDKRPYSFRCRMCARRLCVQCIRDGLCPPCWEKSTGKKYHKPSGPCFITDACIEAAGLPDDCIELQMLRYFRDNYLQKSIKGRRMVREYYRVAPTIIEEIRKKANSSEIFSEIFEEIKKIVSQIKFGDYEKAYMSFETMVLQLKRRYLHTLPISFGDESNPSP